MKGQFCSNEDCLEDCDPTLGQVVIGYFTCTRCGRKNNILDRLRKKEIDFFAQRLTELEAMLNNERTVPTDSVGPCTVNKSVNLNPHKLRLAKQLKRNHLHD